MCPLNLESEGKEVKILREDDNRPGIPILFDPISEGFIEFIQKEMVESGFHLMERNGGVGGGIYVRSHLLYCPLNTDYVYRMWACYRYFLSEYARYTAFEVITRVGTSKRGMQYSAFRRYVYLLKRLHLIKLLDKNDDRRVTALSEMEISIKQERDLERRGLVSIESIEKTKDEPVIIGTDRNFYTLELTNLKNDGWVNPQRALYG